MNYIIRDIRHGLLVAIRWLLSVLIRVQKGKVIFQSYPDYSDNSRALSDFLLANTDYHVYWSVRHTNSFRQQEKITFLETDGGKSLLGKLRFIYHTVSAEFLFSTHAAFLYANGRKQKFVCLWHGAPLKKIGVIQNPVNKNYLSNATCFLCSSEYYVPIMAKCFGREEKRMIPIGIPRNDWLFQESEALQRLGINKEETEKMIVYLPTFRKTDQNKEGDTNQDVFRIGDIDFSSEEYLSKLNIFLRSINVKLVVKPHPADPDQKENSSFSQIMIIPHKRLLECDVQVNQLLHYADALITDFSGVFIDYLNLDRPIGFVLSDYKEYTEQRGFLFERPLDFMPGEKILDENDFKRFCYNVAEGYDQTKNDRERLKNVYNNYTGEGNCRRLAEYLGMALKDRNNDSNRH